MFVKIKNTNGEELFINPDQVSVIAPVPRYSHGDDDYYIGSVIHCGGRTISTNESPDSLMARLENKRI